MNTPLSQLESLRPSGKPTVYQLLQQDGIDVNEWSVGRKPGFSPASNPKYCYAWAFEKTDEFAVLNLWFDEIRINGNALSSIFNMRFATDLEKNPRKARARFFDEVVKNAYFRGLPIHAIIIAGNKSSIASGSKAAFVSDRMLDQTPWHIESYNVDSGEFVVTRGPRQLLDQYTLPHNHLSRKPKISVTVELFIRDRRIRDAALKRPNGRCEFADCIAFKNSIGQAYLETHHVVPLSRGGEDSINNVAALCPNHHREAHFGAAAENIRQVLQKKISLPN